MKILWLFAVTSTFTLCAQDAATLTREKCGVCHMMSTPKYEQMGTFKVPPFDAVMYHLKDAINDVEKQKAFILDYVIHPDASKSVCESNKVAYYGVMPSMKGKITHKELDTIADYLIAHYPDPKFTAMIKEMLTNDRLRALQQSPFLIDSESLPHFTQLLIRQWDKASLGLSEAQKRELLRIRKETLSQIKRIKATLQPLEEEVAEAMIDHESPDSVEKTLERIAQLKLEATRIHLKCIYETTEVLSEEQIEALLPIWQ